MKKHIADQFELPDMPPSLKKPRQSASKDILAIFDRLRFDPKTHRGNGDIILSREKQVEIIEILKKL